MQNSIIDDSEQLKELCEKIQHSQVVAIDTEFLRDKTYYGKLCLIQLATEDVITCVDPLNISDMSPLLDYLYRTDVLKIMHSARQDLEMFYDITGKIPKPLYDTQIAATLVGFGDQTGYAKLVKSMLGVNLDKAHARTDWSQRPLDSSQMEYALDDVRYLIPMYQQQLRMLESKGRGSWLDDDFNRLTDSALYKPDPDELWKRVKGGRNLKGQQLAVLQRLAIWREEHARQLDRPRRWLMSDDILVEMSKRQPQNADAVEKIRGCNSYLKKNSDNLVKLIRAARELPREDWPDDDRPESLSVEQEAMVDILMGVIRVKALQNDVTPALLTTRRDLERLVCGEKDMDLMHGWRYELVGKEIIKFIQGGETIQVRNNQIIIEPVQN